MIAPKTINRLASKHRRAPAGAPQRLKTSALIAGLVHHALQAVGTLGEHVRAATGIGLSESSLSERRQRLPWAVMERILAVALTPRARLKQEAHAFYKGQRLVGLDGLSFSARNTPSILSGLHKAKSRRHDAAFAKLPVVVLMELGMHNPLALAVGREGESERRLASRLFQVIPAGCLALVDRLYGVGPVVGELMAAREDRQVEWLARVKVSIHTRLLLALPDGSAVVEVRDGPRRHRVREIQGVVRARNGRRVHVRLWTSLLDARRHPALKLLALYARRWEHEIGNKELKVDMRGAPLLQSQTVETAAQEVAALVLAQAILVKVRQHAGQTVGVLRISFVRVLDVVQKLWWLAALAEDLLPPDKLVVLVRRAMRELERRASAPRRARSCPRALRQPVSPWPRLLHNTQEKGKIRYSVTPVST